MAEPESPESPQKYETICNVPPPGYVVPVDAAPPLLKVPKEEDNDAMRLWRASVHPYDNIGEPSSAEWGHDVLPEENALPLDFPYYKYNTKPRWIWLEYPNPDGAFPINTEWIPGKKYEYGWSKINTGENADEIPHYRVTHDEVPHVPLDPIPISDLDSEHLDHLVSAILFRDKTYIKKFVNSHIIPIHPFDADFTPEKADRIRQAIANILIGAAFMFDGEAEIEVSDNWSQFERDPENPCSNESGSDKMALNIELLEAERYYEQAYEPANPDNSYDGGSKRHRRIKSTNKRSKRRGKSTKKRSKKRVGKSRKRQRQYK